MQNKRRIYLATGNLHKVREFQQLAEASGMPVEFIRAENMPAVVEDTGTFIGNARKKAAALKAVLPPEAWVLADDSGLCVEALNGAPGVESAYFAGPQGDPAANLAKLVEVMRNNPTTDRRAYFVSVLVFHAPNGVEHVSEGKCEGRLSSEPAGGAGFGYDPIFVPDGFEATYAELTESEKNKLSHRGRAWADLTKILRGNL